MYDGCQGCLQLRKTGQPRVYRGTSPVKVQWDRRTYPLISDAPVDTLPPLPLPVTPPYCVVLPLYILTSRDEPLSLTLNSAHWNGISNNLQRRLAVVWQYTKHLPGDLSRDNATQLCISFRKDIASNDTANAFSNV